MTQENKNKEESAAKEKTITDIEQKKENPEEIKKKLKESEKLKNEYLAGWQRARADFINHKREETERMEGLLKYAQEEFILKILSILDNFDLVEKKMPKELKNDENVKGLLQIKNQILNFLKSQKVEEIKSVGEIFNPSLHEAIEEVAKEGLKPSTIVQEIQKGYMIGSRLLRPAKVKVSK